MTAAPAASVLQRRVVAVSRQVATVLMRSGAAAVRGSYALVAGDRGRKLADDLLGRLHSVR